MIEQLIPLGEIGVLMAIYQRLGRLRTDTDQNGNRIGKNRERIDRLKERLKDLEGRFSKSKPAS